MENTGKFDIVVKAAFLVSKDAITPTSAFEMMEVGTYGTTTQVWYLSEKGWNKANNYSWGNGEIVYTQIEADELKKKKIEEHIKYLEGNVKETEKKIIEMKETLAK